MPAPHDQSPTPEELPNRAARRAQRHGRKGQAPQGNGQFHQFAAHSRRYVPSRRDGRRGNR